MGRRDSRPPHQRGERKPGRHGPGRKGPAAKAPLSGGAKAQPHGAGKSSSPGARKAPFHKAAAKAPFHKAAAKAPFNKAAKPSFRGSAPAAGSRTQVGRAPIEKGPRTPRPDRDNRPPRPDRDHQPSEHRARAHEPGGESKGGAPRREGPSREEIWIYGYHPAAAALANPQRKILRIIATPEAAERLRGDTTVPADITARLRVLARRDIDQLVGEDAVHQGIAVLVRPLDHHLQDILSGLEGRADVCLVLLDQVTDPHNVGAVLRSAAAFGASAVIAPDRHAPDESGVMAKSASGALDKLPYVKTVNLVRAIELMKEFQFWLVGLDAEAPTALSAIDLGGRIALVLGAEGEGIRRLVADACDHRAKLPISSAMESLNVSNAAAVALYEKARQAAAPKNRGPRMFSAGNRDKI